MGTEQLQGQGQRQAPIETVGLVIGTAGGVPYVHLQLEQARRMYDGGLPILVVNDGEDSRTEAPQLRELCEKYGATYKDGPYLGHSTGDLRVFKLGLEWADANGITLLAKFSRRFVPLVSWRHGLIATAAGNLTAAAFTRKNMDTMGGLFRTDCIALRVRKWRDKEFLDVIEESLKRVWLNVSVEPMMEALTRVRGGWELWDLIGIDFHRACKTALQWRGVEPCHYGDLSRELGLDYKDEAFVLNVDGTVTDYLAEDLRPKPPAENRVEGMLVIDPPAGIDSAVAKGVDDAAARAAELREHAVKMEAAKDSK